MRPRTKRPRHGEVAEWSNVPDSKSGVRVTVPWVRIPPSPPKTHKAPSGPFLFLPERGGRLRALRGGIRRVGPTSPARPNRQFAVRRANGAARRGRALQSGQARCACQRAFATKFQFEGRRQLGLRISDCCPRSAQPRAPRARAAKSAATHPQPQPPESQQAAQAVAARRAEEQKSRRPETLNPPPPPPATPASKSSPHYSWAAPPETRRTSAACTRSAPACNSPSTTRVSKHPTAARQTP